MRLVSLLVVLIIAGLLAFWDNQRDVYNDRNEKAAQALDNHHVDILVGDSQRLSRITLNSNYTYQTLPVIGCAAPKTGSLKTDQLPDLMTHSFAYLISLDSPSSCALNDVLKLYGKPNLSSLIAGSLKQPLEQLLFYDKGSNRSSPTINQPASQLPATVYPIPLSQLPNTGCQSRTIMNIVAHQDDDLLFINPDTLHAINAGYCVRTIYLTAGDAGREQFYWLSREQGDESAYDYMDGPSKDIWIKRIVQLQDNEYIRVDNPRGNSKVSLVFMRLPDGNVNGSGFKAQNFQSLVKLESGKITSIDSVERQSTYTSQQLVNALTTLMRVYQPSEIRTQANYISTKHPDHSDHMAAGRYTKRAWQQYDPSLPIKFYIGYPIADRPPNVFGADVQKTETAFLDYAQHDIATCNSLKSCDTPGGYYLYFSRQYTSPY